MKKGTCYSKIDIARNQLVKKVNVILRTKIDIALIQVVIQLFDALSRYGARHCQCLSCGVF